MATGMSASTYPRIHLSWRPWLLVAAAWVVAVVATVTGQRFLLDHHFLLEESGLPWPLAATVFLIGWQVMVASMMVPTSISFAGAAIKRDAQGRRHPNRRLRHSSLATHSCGHSFVRWRSLATH